MKRKASAQQRYQFVKNAVEAQGIHFDHKVKSQVFNKTKLLFVAEQVITITYTELKKSQFLSFVNNAGNLKFKNVLNLQRLKQQKQYSNPCSETVKNLPVYGDRVNLFEKGHLSE